MKYFIPFAFLFFTVACSENNSANLQDDATKNTEKMEKYAHDSHSFSEPNHVATTHLDLDIKVDFDSQTILGTATYDLERTSGNTLKLDDRNLNIEKVVSLPANEELEFEVKKGNAYGDELIIQLTDETEKVEITYATSPDAAALMWMTPDQTLGKDAPFMFTQGQAILTRSWIPVQDSPSVRMTYNATVTVPEGMIAVMSAVNPTEKNDNGVYKFEMNQPIPPYLMALAVGNLEFKSLGERTGVYAEPAMIERAVHEFADVEKMVNTAENLYGDYRWERYDLLVLPPSFPFGGMENPRLTFVTPTIVAGDRSLITLVAHELAHSWSGNLVTNATWNDFWLNEGFTVYIESRIMEEAFSPEYAEMLFELSQQDLLATIEELGPESPDTHLKLNLEGRDADDGMTDIAYDKGSLFLRWLEQQVGREKLDAFLKQYFNDNAFKSMTTEKFVEYLDEHLLSDLNPRPDVEAWIYGPGLPEGYPTPNAQLFDKVDEARTAFINKELSASQIQASQWSTHEWLHFLRKLPDDLSDKQMKALDAQFNFTNSTNSEIAAEWFLLSIRNDYQPAFNSMAEFLNTVGRRKFLKPIYEELAKTDAHKKWALEVYKDSRKNYHTVSTQTIDQILGYHS